MKICFLAALFFVCFSTQAQLPPYVPANGLMACFPFDGNSNDHSGNGNNPVFNNATLTANRFGVANSAYHFNGINNYMKVANTTSLNTGSEMSISLWVKPLGYYTGTCYNNLLLMKGDADYLSGNYFLRFSDVYTGCTNPTTSEERFYGQGVVADTPLVQLNNWYHVVWTCDGTSSKIYVNGQLKNMAAYSGSGFTNAFDLYIGRLNNAQYPYWLNGDLDDICLYNRSITPDEVLDLYHQCPNVTAPAATAASRCDQGTLTLSTSNVTGSTTDWYAAATGGTVLNGGVGVNSFITPVLSTTTTYYAESRDLITGCISASRTPVVATIHQSPVVSISATPSSIVLPGQSITLVASSTPSGNSFNWYNNGNVIAGQNSNSLVVSFNQSGNYSATQMDANGCIGNSNIIAVKDSLVNHPFIYPNPNNGDFYVQFDGMPYGDNKWKIQLFDEKGARVYSKDFAPAYAFEPMSISAKKLSAGNYVVVLFNSSNTILAVGKVVIQ